MDARVAGHLALERQCKCIPSGTNIRRLVEHARKAAHGKSVFFEYSQQFLPPSMNPRKEAVSPLAIFLRWRK